MSGKSGQMRILDTLYELAGGGVSVCAGVGLLEERKMFCEEWLGR